MQVTSYCCMTLRCGEQERKTLDKNIQTTFHKQYVTYNAKPSVNINIKYYSETLIHISQTVRCHDRAGWLNLYLVLYSNVCLAISYRD
jgi:hypothetical protein